MMAHLLRFVKMKSATPFLFFLALGLLNCTGAKHFSKKIVEPVLEQTTVDAPQQERDDIFSLLAYALVYQDWQQGSVPRNKRRGYNIGAVLVNPQFEPVFHGLNCINSTDNATQHGEVRAITQYLEQTRKFNLDKYHVYTTLEPCVMCAGMITMVSVGRVVYGQHDVDYSKAFERLAMDTRPIGGFAPYPRRVQALASQLPFCKQLDDAYKVFLSSDPEKVLAKFLTSEGAEAIYKQASADFFSYTIKYSENQSVYEKALAFYHKNAKK